MILPLTHIDMLQRGLCNTTTTKDKWHIVFMIILPHLIECEMHEDKIAPYDHELQKAYVAYTQIYKIKKVSFTGDELILSVVFPQDRKRPDWKSIWTSDVTFSLKIRNPLLDEHKLIFQNTRGEKMYILLKTET